MYCLNCGSEIKQSESQCPSCGSLVSDMLDRIAAAQEMVRYNDVITNIPPKTEKLPLVKERMYWDKEGKPLNPAASVDVSKLKHSRDLSAIPEIGNVDPNVTMPMVKIVSDEGNVVADVDRNAKTYRLNRNDK